jgi:hypothetical protein
MVEDISFFFNALLILHVGDTFGPSLTCTNLPRISKTIPSGVKIAPNERLRYRPPARGAVFGFQVVWLVSGAGPDLPYQSSQDEIPIL